MNIPKVITTKYGTRNLHVLKLINNLYGQKKSGKVCNEYLKSVLTRIGFKPSKVDPCVFYKGKRLFFVYFYYEIFSGPYYNEITQEINDLQAEDFDIYDRGNIADYLGINAEKLCYGRIKLSHPRIIDQIIEDCGLSPNTRIKKTTCKSSKILHRFEDRNPCYAN